MTLRNLYLVVVIGFYVSVFVVFFAGQIGLLLRGHNINLAFASTDVLRSNPTLQAMYYEAYRDSSETIKMLVKSGFAVWGCALAFSLHAIIRHVELPFKLGIVTAVVAGFLTLFIAIPVVVFGDKFPSGILW